MPCDLHGLEPEVDPYSDELGRWWQKKAGEELFGANA
jgi:hypothetical protein